MNLEDVSLLRRSMSVTWLTFFGRFGGVTPVQIQAIPKILAGKNVVNASPTASGKTEAVTAPVIEFLFAKKNDIQTLSIIYVVPTRALANDTFARLSDAIQGCNLSTGIKHGDKPHLSTPLPHFLITTPESLDSLISRRSNSFENLDTLIVDEIHLLDNTYRGDQLRVLIQRLKELNHGDFATHLLSATLKDPQKVAERYSHNFEIIGGSTQRDIRYQFKQSHEEILRLAQTNKWRKLLYFCNKRETVEEIAAQLRPVWHPYPVMVHHGSLDRRIREETETLMKTAKVAICVATSTLEVGIDVGNIDAVVLCEVPWSISSLQQRIGRGNRRKDYIEVIGLTQTKSESEILEAMLQSAIQGELSEIPYEADLSVVVQQIFSYLFQNPLGADFSRIIKLIEPLCTNQDARLILQHLAQQGLIEHYNSKWFASTEIMNMGEKGKIHSNIPDTYAYQVIDTNSGKKVGNISGDFDAVFVFARKAWKVTKRSGNTVYVIQFHGSASSAVFRRTENQGAFHDLLPPVLQNGASPPTWR